jgi:hypothetical protein
MRYKSVENNYYFTGILIILMVLLAFFGGPAHSGSTQTNTSGSNTAIEGGYTSTATTTYQSGSSSNSTTNSTTNSNIRSAPPSSSAPSYNSMTQDVCAVGASVGVQTFGVGVSGGKHFIDKNMLAIIFGVVAGVFAYTELTARLVSLETSRELFENDLLKKSEQVPVDQEQHFLLEDLYKSVEKMEETQEMNMTNKVNIEFLREQLDQALADIEDLKDKVRANGKTAH